MCTAVVCASLLAAGCTVYRFRLEPEPPSEVRGATVLRGSYEYAYETEYSRPPAESAFRERLEETLDASGDFVASPAPSGAFHLRVRVHRRFHGAAGQEWLTGLTLGLIPSTAERETFVFEFTALCHGEQTARARTSLHSRAYSWIFLAPWAEPSESPTQYGQGVQVDHFERALRGFLGTLPRCA